MKKTLYWDLETGGLDADWANIICIGYRVTGEPRRVISIRDFKGWTPYDDRRVIQEFLKVWTRDDIGVEVAYNSTLFDIPYIQARMGFHGMGVLPLLGHVDPYWTAKSKLRLSSKSLAVVSEFLGCPYSKTPVTRNAWRLAKGGDEKSLEYIERHCLADIKVLEWVYEKRLRPLMRRHPVIGEYGDCHNCGKDTLERRGYATTVLRGRQIRYHCTSCGAWSSRPELKKKTA